MSKCDVVIPVYKSPEWVELCLYALFQNTESDTLNRVYLINDSSDAFTKNCLMNLKAKYGEKVVIKQNKKNIGFTGTANIGLRLSRADYVLLLNTDCIISKKTIEKLMHHMQKDEKIGLICPISSNAANLSLEIPEGFTYMQINEILEKRFSGLLFDACTVVGNCLMISRKCLDKVGFFDEVYAPGYGEETDYQFKAMKEGFLAKIAIDTYVFHKAETSFGVSEAKKKMVEEHLAIFFSRWKKEYYRELEKYNKHDPVKYILENFKNDPPRIDNSAMFYVMNINDSGGCNVVIDIINRLAINGHQCNIIYHCMSKRSDFMLFNPVPIEKVDEVSTKVIVATLWVTTFLAKKIALKKKWKMAYFVQGLEQHFEDGRNYGSVETSYKISDGLVVVSKPLQSWLKDVYGIDSYLIQNGINLELLKKAYNKKRRLNTILLITRNDYRKCNYVLFDILRKIDIVISNVSVNIVVSDSECTLPFLHNKKNTYNIIEGPLERANVFELMQNSDIYIDTSYSEGFGLTALESMAAGCIPIVSDSFGVRDYLVDSKNGLIVKSINDANVYIEKIKKLMDDQHLCQKISEGMLKTVTQYDFNNRINDYIRAFCILDVPKNHFQKLLNVKEKEISNRIIKIFDKTEEQDIVEAPVVPKYSKKQRIVRRLAKMTPKPVRTLFVKVIESLRSCY